MSPAPQSHMQPDLLCDPTKIESAPATKIEPVPPSNMVSLPSRKEAYDECTLRLIFIEMDANANGTVTKEEFINYLRSRPQLQNIMYGGLVPGHRDEVGKLSPQQERAMGMKRVLKVYKSIDINKNGVLCLEEFINFFRHAGLLLTYVTQDNPRDRMADVLNNEYQRRQVVAKWQRGGAILGVGQQKGLDIVTEELNCKFLLEQKQAELNTKWASEKLAQLKEQSAKGRDAFSVVAKSVDAFKPKVFKVRPGRRYVTDSEIQNGLVPQTPETVESEAQCLADSHRSSPSPPSVSSTPRARPSTPDQKMLEAEPNIVKTETPEPKALESPVQLPRIPPSSCTNGLCKQSPRKICKSPMRRKERSHSNKTPRKCQQTSPKRSLSRRRTKSGLSASPIKRGQTPRHKAETPGFVHQSRFGLNNELEQSMLSNAI